MVLYKKLPQARESHVWEAVWKVKTVKTGVGNSCLTDGCSCGNPAAGAASVWLRRGGPENGGESLSHGVSAVRILEWCEESPGQ